MKVPLVLDTEDKITPQAVRESATSLIPAGAVLLVVRSGILVHSIPVAIAGRELALNQDLKALIPRSEIVPDYLLYTILGLHKEFLAEWKKEGATVESLELDLVVQTQTFPTNYREQRSIAAFLDRRPRGSMRWWRRSSRSLRCSRNSAPHSLPAPSRRASIQTPPRRTPASSGWGIFRHIGTARRSRALRSLGATGPLAAA